MTDQDLFYLLAATRGRWDIMAKNYLPIVALPSLLKQNQQLAAIDGVGTNLLKKCKGSVGFEKQIKN
jgi:hypothetical protein